MYERATELLEADLGDELVALDPVEGNCFGFNGVATVVWKHLDQPRSFEELRRLLLVEYRVDEEQCGIELQQLIDDLIDKGLVRKRTNQDRP